MKVNIFVEKFTVNLFCFVEIFSGIASCANYICFKDYRGNAVAISPSQALTALHGAVSNGEQVSLRDHRGKQRNASVIFSAFEELRFDIAVVELHKGEDPFEHFIPICDEPVKCGQKIYVVGLTPSLHDKETVLQCVGADVIGIEPSSSLFRSSYSSFDGLSGAGVIVSLEYGQYHCVGVHVGTHDDTSSPPPIKRKKGGVADFDSVSDSSNSLASSIHGHTAYTLICEARRVPKLSDVININ